MTTVVVQWTMNELLLHIPPNPIHNPFQFFCENLTILTVPIQMQKKEENINQRIVEYDSVSPFSLVKVHLEVFLCISSA